jgi:hypothetical protein
MFGFVTMRLSQTYRRGGRFASTEPSLAQQDFAMGRVTRRIFKGRVDIGFFK